MTLHSRQALLQNLKNKRFRDAFVSARVDAGLAFQTRSLRQKKGWSQVDLARRLDTSQNAICRLESPNYGKASISTLKKVASVFDVALVVRYVRFSALVNDALNLSTESVIVDSFDEDQGLEPVPISNVTIANVFVQVEGGTTLGFNVPTSAMDNETWALGEQDIFFIFPIPSETAITCV